MSNRGTKRAMSDVEREIFQRTLIRVPSLVTRCLGGVYALVSWAVVMLIFVCAWAVISWLARVTMRVEIGWSSVAAIWIGLVGALASAAIATVSSLRWVKAWQNARPELRADIDAGTVVEEIYEFTAAKRFQEPEHGGLIYFLRTRDDKVFVQFDYESQDLGARGGNPLSSAFHPRTKLSIIRGPKSGVVISHGFSGDILDAGAPLELSIGPESWPESDTYCDIPWQELESRLSAGAPS
jgi:hypothetical protein